ncbi:MAG: aminotransferase class I/II-fold pyridoxal phosphate-dependent enzyme [Halobacteriota archaeon]
MLADLVIEHDLSLVSDKIYEKILFDDRTHHSPSEIDGLFDRTVTVNGRSKAYSITGWRLSYLCAPRNQIDPIICVGQYSTTRASSITQHAAVEAVSVDLYQILAEAFENHRD